jgi:hypothetical protein
MENQNISFDRAKLERLKARMAETGNSETFMFEGHEFVRGYARYLVEYLEGEFARATGQGKN